MATQGLQQVQRLGLQQTLSPQMQQSLHILQVPALELSTLIRQELTSNPVLEEAATETEEVTDPAKLDETDNAESEEETALDKEFEQLARLDEEWRDYFNQHNAPARPSSEEDKLRQTFFESVASPETLQEHLLAQLHMVEVEESLRSLCETLIGNMDENGFLSATQEEITAWDKPVGSFKKVISIIQSFDPIGVGSRDLQECLLIQLQRLGHKEDSLAYHIVADHLQDLAEKRYAEISEALEVPLADVHRVSALVSTLDPRPGSRFTVDHNNYVTPDLIVQKIGEDWAVLTNDDWLPSIRISNTYKDILGQSSQNNEAKSYVRERLRAAKFFIKSIQQRQQTVLKIANEILAVQILFFEQGQGFLKPLTMTEVARKIGVHETTVSRAIANKYMQTPHGIYELKYFFTPGIRTADGGSITQDKIKAAIAELVSSEPADKPLADLDINRLLKEKGITIARRTVAKYREEMNILPSYLRRSKAG